MSAKAITCLLTGFDAFGAIKVNPTEVIVETFPDLVKTKPSGVLRRVKEIHIEKRILPTAGVKAWKQLKTTLDHVVEQSSGPLCVVMSGLADNRNTFSLERFAINIKDYSIADNSGHQPLDKPIDAKAPDLLRSKLDLAALNKLANDLGFPTHISNHAGTFICNELYFRTLNYALTQPKIKSVLFVHVPNPKRFARAAAKSTKKSVAQAAIKANTSKKQIDFLAVAMAEIVEGACKLI